MSEVLNLTGFIKDVKYRACLTESLDRVSLEQFDVNKSKAYGIIAAQNTEVAYSKWVSPKRTRSYPNEPEAIHLQEFTTHIMRQKY
jgi:hypothetical protein